MVAIGSRDDKDNLRRAAIAEWLGLVRNPRFRLLLALYGVVD